MSATDMIPQKTYDALVGQFNDVLKTLDNREKQIESLDCMLDDYFEIVNKLEAQKAVLEIKLQAANTRIGQLRYVLDINGINEDSDEDSDEELDEDLDRQSNEEFNYLE